MPCAPGRRKSPTYYLPDLEISKTSSSFLMRASNICWVQGIERSLLWWNREKRMMGPEWGRGELRALLIYLIYCNLIYLITLGISFPLPQTQLVEDFCVISHPLLSTPISEDTIIPAILGPLEINYNNNVFIESGTNISLYFPQRKLMHRRATGARFLS